MEWLLTNIWLVPVYPLLAALIIILGRGILTGSDGKPLASNRAFAPVLVCGSTAVGLAHSVAALLWMFGQGGGHVQPIEVNIPWLVAGELTFSVGYLLDQMTVMMLCVVTFISLFIQIYTHGYMKHDEGYCKFYAFLALFNFAMLGLVISTNLFQMYIFWELVGVCSYLLIGFWAYKKSAGAAAIKAFLMNRVGDFGFLVGLLALLFLTWDFWGGYLEQHANQAILSFQGLPAAAASIASMPGGEILLVGVAVLIFFGPMAKSAQVPFHTWLPDAMEGPTPISALIHAATMVAAGVYLVGRAYPLFAATEAAMTVVVIIGLLTAVIGATIAITQTDIKKALAYSTMSQLGFMVTAMGLGAFTAGLFHLFTHAFFKAMLFLCSGSVIHACEDEQDMRKMGGLWKKLPVTGTTYLIGCIAISGLFYTAGFWSKDEILASAQNHPIFAEYAYVILAGAACLTAFYMFRTFFMTFMGEYRGEAHVHHEDPWMTVPLAVLAVPSLIIGWLLSGVNPAFYSFSEFIHYHFASTHFLEALNHHHPPSFTSTIAIQSQLIGLVGLALAILFYSPWKIFDPNTFRVMLSPLYTLFSKKWFFDEFYGGVVRSAVLPFSNLSARFDRGIIDGLVNWSGRTVYGTGSVLRMLHSGNIQTYIAIALFGIVTLSLALIYWMM